MTTPAPTLARTLGPDELRRLELLVDGELDLPAQKELLARVEALAAAPVDDPWRQVALAYVEAQCWRDDFAALRAAADFGDSTSCVAASDAQPAPPSSASGRSRSRRSAPLLTSAAGLLLAFGLGMWAQTFRAPGEQPGSSFVEDRTPQREIELQQTPTLVGGHEAPGFLEPRRPVVPLHVQERLQEAGQPLSADSPVELHDLK